MKYLIVLVFFLSEVGVLTAQTSKEDKLRDQLYEVAYKYVSYSDLSKQNVAGPKCEPFNEKIGEQFKDLFKDNTLKVLIPNIYSNSLILYLNKDKKKSIKINYEDLYISCVDYFTMVDPSGHISKDSIKNKGNLKAYTHSPLKNASLNVNILNQHEKKIKGDQYISKIGFSYVAEVEEGEKHSEIEIPVILTCIYSLDSTRTAYTTPKIENIEIKELEPHRRYDFYFSPYIGLSSGTLLFKNELISEFKNRNKGNHEFGVLMQIKNPNSDKRKSSSLILGIGYRQINFKHDLDTLTLNVSNETPPFSPFDGIVTGYSKEIKLMSIKEETSMKMITVPLGIGFDFRLGNSNSKRYLYFNPIINFGFPIEYKSKYSSGTVDYIGHFDIAGPSTPFKITIDDAKDFGFGTGYVAKPASQNYKLGKINIAAELEAGYKYNIGSSTAINIGSFVSYGLLNNFEKNKVIPSQITPINGELISYPYFSNPIRNLLFGVKLSVQSFVFQKKKKINSIGSYNPNLNK
jgi:hypothetical protein